MTKIEKIQVSIEALERKKKLMDNKIQEIYPPSSHEHEVEYTYCYYEVLHYRYKLLKKRTELAGLKSAACGRRNKQRSSSVSIPVTLCSSDYRSPSPLERVNSDMKRMPTPPTDKQPTMFRSPNSRRRAHSAVRQGQRTQRICRESPLTRSCHGLHC